MDRTPPSLSHPDPLSPTYAFSPSKARAYRLQAADWAYVDSWLSTHCPNGAPQFERDEDTLKTLLQLAKQNESADEERALIRNVREEALAEYEGQKRDDESNKILQAISSSLPSSAAANLSTLAEATVALDTADSDPETLAHGIIALTTMKHTLKQQQDKLDTLHAYLESEIIASRKMLEDVQMEKAFKGDETMPQRTQTYLQQTKQLKAKVREYEDRLVALPARGTVAQQAVSVEALSVIAERMDDLERLRGEVEGLEGMVRAYEGLPTDVDKARDVVRGKIKELEKLREKRDGAFAGLVKR